jgi:hypothetical protein
LSLGKADTTAVGPAAAVTVSPDFATGVLEISARPNKRLQVARHGEGVTSALNRGLTYDFFRSEK